MNMQGAGKRIIHGTILDSIDSPKDQPQEQEERKAGVALARKFNRLQESMSSDIKAEQETNAIMIEEEESRSDREEVKQEQPQPVPQPEEVKKNMV